MSSINDKILKSLAELENNLNSVNSAKNQVEFISKSTNDLINNLKEFLQTYDEHQKIIKNEVNELSKFDFLQSLKQIDKDIINQFDNYIKSKIKLIEEKDIDLQNLVDKLTKQIIKIENFEIEKNFNSMKQELNNSRIELINNLESKHKSLELNITSKLNEFDKDIKSIHNRNLIIFGVCFLITIGLIIYFNL